MFEEVWNFGYCWLFQDDVLWLLLMWESWREVEFKCVVVWQGLVDLFCEQCWKFFVDLESFDENQDVSYCEWEILWLVVVGLLNCDIVQVVYLLEVIIKWYLYNLFVKLGVKSRM